MSASVYEFFGTAVETLHALAMLLWGVGLPLLFWHRFPRLSELYMVYAVVFVSVSVASHFLLGECVLTTLARWSWEGAGVQRDELPFTAHLANFLAGLSPDRREVVLAWEAAVLVTSAGGLWHWTRTRGARAK